MINIRIIPNIITISRIVLSFVFLLLAKIGLSTYAFIIFIIAIITDFLDGYLARKLNAVTTTGKILDPIADKLIIIFGFIIAYLHDIVPRWFVFLLITKELVLIIGAIILISKNKTKHIKSNIFGKLLMLTQSVYLIYVFFNSLILNTYSNKILNNTMLYILALLVVITLISYLYLFIKNLITVKN
jgi:CDP-diacylglycerol--glycerol-3-phosphate 3-phosphatidyltransferase